MKYNTSWVYVGIKCSVAERGKFLSYYICINSSNSSWVIASRGLDDAVSSDTSIAALVLRIRRTNGCASVARDAEFLADPFRRVWPHFQVRILRNVSGLYFGERLPR